METYPLYPVNVLKVLARDSLSKIFENGRIFPQTINMKTLNDVLVNIRQRGKTSQNSTRQ